MSRTPTADVVYVCMFCLCKFWNLPGTQRILATRLEAVKHIMNDGTEVQYTTVVACRECREGEPCPRLSTVART